MWRQTPTYAPFRRQTRPISCQRVSGENLAQSAQPSGRRAPGQRKHPYPATKNQRQMARSETNQRRSGRPMAAACLWRSGLQTSALRRQTRPAITWPVRRIMQTWRVPGRGQSGAWIGWRRCWRHRQAERLAGWRSWLVAWRRRTLIGGVAGGAGKRFAAAWL